MKKLITQETVSLGHPDKIADFISSRILDEYIKVDENVKLGCEVMVTPTKVIIGGEVKSKKVFNDNEIKEIVKDAIIQIGYIDTEKTFNHLVEVENKMISQSPQINSLVEKEDLGAGDQGIMFGFATNETKEFLKLPYVIARGIEEKIRNYGYDYILPDGKTQVSVQYENDKPKSVQVVVVSISHKEGVYMEKLRIDVMNCIREYIEENELTLLFKKTEYKINYLGEFSICGPESDCGITNRKLCVDNGYYVIGGGGLSGKDGSKVDLSGALYNRYVAKNMVSTGLFNEVLIQTSYVIGESDINSLNVETKGNKTTLTDEELSKKIKSLFSFKPKDIIDILKLKEPKYSTLNKLGFFGRTNSEYTWENLDLAEKITKKIGKYLKEEFKEENVIKQQIRKSRRKTLKEENIF
jgi:S-adenosylmethionine synthetase